MEDPLRPKIVPLSAETILWFEFLIDPNLLTQHLQKENPEPSPIELMSQFLSESVGDIYQQQLQQQQLQLQQQLQMINPVVDMVQHQIQPPPLPPPPTIPPPTMIDYDSQSMTVSRNEGLLKLPRKQLAIKILILKIAAHLKWDLEVFEKNLPVQKQIQLLSDLCTITSGQFVQLPLATMGNQWEYPLGPDGSRLSFNFALSLYHRWLLRAQVYKEFPARVIKPGVIHNILTPQEQSNTFRDEMFIVSLEPFTQASIDFLMTIIKNTTMDDQFVVLEYDSFNALNTNSTTIRQNFEKHQRLKNCEIKAQLCYDLCFYYLYSKKYDLAKENAMECHKNVQEMKQVYNGNDKYLYCTLNERELEGFLSACGVRNDTEDINLLHQLNESSLMGYQNIIEILKSDNEHRQIPLVNRRMIELSIEGCVTKGRYPATLSKEHGIRVAALNAIRSVLDNDNDLFSYSDFMKKYGKQNGLEYLIEYTDDLLRIKKCINQDEREKLKKFYLNILIKGFADGIINGGDSDKKPTSPTKSTTATTTKSQSTPSSKLSIKRTIELIGKLKLFTSAELDFVKMEQNPYYNASEQKLSKIVEINDWKMCDSKVYRLGVGSMKRQLIKTKSFNTTRKFIMKLFNLNLGMPIWSVNASWHVPKHLRPLVMSLPRGIIQDLTYIIIAKSRELAEHNYYPGAISMLTSLKNELQQQQQPRADIQNAQITMKLTRILDSDIMLYQIQQSFEDWPKKFHEHHALVKKCKQYLIQSQQQQPQSQQMNNDFNYIHYTECIDYTAVMLLNLNEWHSLVYPDKRYPVLDLCTLFAYVCSDIEQYKTNLKQKSIRDIWEMITPIYYNSMNNGNNGGSGGGSGGNTTGGNSSSNMGGNNLQNNKRPQPQPLLSIQTTAPGGGGMGGNSSGIRSSRDSPLPMNGISFNGFIKKLRDLTIISVVLSLLVRLHNILKDESNVDINAEFMYLWPASISNANGYSLKNVSETLYNLLNQGLKYFPHHMAWIRLKGDLEFANDNYEAAMSCYVNVLITGSEYCTLHLQRPFLDDYIIKRMIRCSSNLGCNTQAVILCQFLEETDYTLAFKTFSEKSTRSANHSDAMDGYYNYIWDTTILEYIIHSHNKKNEHKRRQQAVNLIGLLELNANNNDEIKREAATIRKTKFIRALAKQYLL